jgi:hypothetical protein
MMHTLKEKTHLLGTTDATGINMNFLDIWHELSYTDGMMFSLWIGIMYYGKCRIDHKFKCKEKKDEV